jgi:hypothetical protein
MQAGHKGLYTLEDYDTGACVSIEEERVGYGGEEVGVERDERRKMRMRKLKERLWE